MKKLHKFSKISCHGRSRLDHDCVQMAWTEIRIISIVVALIQALVMLRVSPTPDPDSQAMLHMLLFVTPVLVLQTQSVVSAATVSAGQFAGASQVDSRVCRHL